MSSRLRLANGFPSHLDEILRDSTLWGHCPPLTSLPSPTPTHCAPDTLAFLLSLGWAKQLPSRDLCTSCSQGLRSIQLHLIPTFPSTSMSCAFLWPPPSARNVLPCLAYLGNSRFRNNFFDVVSQSPRLIQPLLPLCFFWIGVLAFRTQSLIYLCVLFSLQAGVGHVWCISMTPAPNMGPGTG